MYHDKIRKLIDKLHESYELEDDEKTEIIAELYEIVEEAVNNHKGITVEEAEILRKENKELIEFQSRRENVIAILKNERDAVASEYKGYKQGVAASIYSPIAPCKLGDKFVLDGIDDVCIVTSIEISANSYIRYSPEGRNTSHLISVEDFIEDAKVIGASQLKRSEIEPVGNRDNWNEYPKTKPTKKGWYDCWVDFGDGHYCMDLFYNPEIDTFVDNRIANVFNMYKVLDIDNNRIYTKDVSVYDRTDTVKRWAHKREWRS